jgi:hypothetical protein
MKHRLAILAAAAVTAVGFASATTFAQEDPARTPPPVDRPLDRQIDRAGDKIAPDAEDIRDIIAQVTEAAVTKTGLDDLTERLVDADRNRLGKEGVVDRKDDQLDGIIDQFRRNWNTKYNQDFDIKDEATVYTTTFAMVTQGEIGDAARLAAQRDAGVSPSGQPDVRPGPEADKVTGGDTNREPGRNIATVTIVESHGLPTLVIPMVHEMPDAWKVDLPDNVTGQQIRDNLAKCLTKLNENQAQWPSDVNDGYRIVTHKVLVAVMNQPVDSGRVGPGAMDRPMPGSTPGQTPPR